MRHRVLRPSRVALALLAATLPLISCAAPTPPAENGPANPPTTTGSDPLVVGEVPTISRADVQAGLAEGDITIVDTLPEAMHVQRHLPGSVNIPGYPYENAAANTDRLAPRRLPDKSANLVLYCLNVPCRNSEFVGRRLKELGYSSVRKYPGGMEDWLEAGLRTEGTTAR